MTDIPIVPLNKELPISVEIFVGLVKLAQKYSEINQQYGIWKKIDPSMCAFLSVKCSTLVAFVIPSKTLCLQNLFLKF